MTIVSDEVQRQRAKMYAKLNPKGCKFLFKLTESATKRGYRGEQWTTEEVLAEMENDGAAVLFTSFGTIDGVEHFARSTFVREDIPFSQAVMIADAGKAVIAYGPHYKFRILIKD